MSNFEDSTQDFERSPVPDSSTVSGWEISVVKIGGVIALPAFMLGAELGGTLGLTNAFYAMAVGGLLLAILAGFTGTVAARSRLSTSMITQFAFGAQGSRVVNGILALTCLGWFGVTADLFGSTLKNVFFSLWGIGLSQAACTIFGGFLMVATTIFGFKALKKLSNFIVPALFIFLIMINYLALQKSSFADLMAYKGTGLSFGLAVSAVVGGLIVAATIFPDLCRFARNANHGRLAAVLGFALAIPVVLTLATIPSVATGKKDLVFIMINLGVSIPALFVLVFAAWTTNSGNLYSASLGFSVIFSRVPKWKLCIVSGVAGTAFAISGITNYFIPFLVLLGVTIPPVAGIYVADFFLVQGQKYDIAELGNRPAYSLPAFISWILASAFAFATSRGMFTGTGVPAVDSVISAFLIYLVAERLLRPASREAGTLSTEDGQAR